MTKTPDELREALKMEGECWHEGGNIPSPNPKHPRTFLVPRKECEKCDLPFYKEGSGIHLKNNGNPDLLSAQGKLWIEERLLRREDVEDVFYMNNRIKGEQFICYIGAKKNTVNYKQYKAKADSLPQALYRATEKYLEEVEDA